LLEEIKIEQAGCTIMYILFYTYKIFNKFLMWNRLFSVKSKMTGYLWVPAHKVISLTGIWPGIMNDVGYAVTSAPG